MQVPKLSETQPLDDEIKVLVDLLQSEDAAVIYLPYTQTFERIYAEFKRRTSLYLAKHELWEMILRLRSHLAAREGASPPPAESPVAVTSGTALGASPGQSPTATGFPESLFPPPESSASAQSGFAPAWQPALQDPVNTQRNQLLARVARSEFGGADSKVCAILEQYPETRESAIATWIRYFQRFNATVLEKWNLSDLDFFYELDNLDTIGRVRREIQNTLQLFRGLESTAQYRLLYQKDLGDYLAARKGIVPEVRFYLDETGNEGDKAYTGVAGVCTINWKHYEMHAAAIRQWRDTQRP
jgi:hypothetical protein